MVSASQAISDAIVADNLEFAANSLDDFFRDLEQRVPELACTYRNARPYPFIVLDDFLPAEIAERVEADFPSPTADVWQRYPTRDQHNKLALRHESLLPSSARQLIHELNSGYFLEILEQLTGIAHLIADAKLIGGGLHQILRGGRLDLHVDYSHHPGNHLNRRLNLILYLNKNWREEYGGHFEMWDRDLKHCEQRIAPLFNRCVIFSTTSFSYHGHPDPLSCPDDRSRKSIALYYYTNGRSEEPGPIVEHNTLFHRRPGDSFSLGSSLMRLASSGLVRDLMPPLLYRWLRRAWNHQARKPVK